MKKDLLKTVRQRLADDVGRLRQVAMDTDIPYDTVLRIKNGEGDPGYSKVSALACHYGLIKESTVRAKKAA